MVKYYNFKLDYEKDELDSSKKCTRPTTSLRKPKRSSSSGRRNSVEFAEFSLENAKLNRDETLKVAAAALRHPDQGVAGADGDGQAQAQMALSLDLNRARYELEQRKKARTKSLDRHAKLLDDRGLMEIKSPADGIVFYGQSVNGRWSETAIADQQVQAEQQRLARLDR